MSMPRYTATCDQSRLLRNHSPRREIKKQIFGKMYCDTVIGGKRKTSKSLRALSEDHSLTVYTFPIIFESG